MGPDFLSRVAFRFDLYDLMTGKHFNNRHTTHKKDFFFNHDMKADPDKIIA
jgi:hypothetical protein